MASMRASLIVLLGCPAVSHCALAVGMDRARPCQQQEHDQLTWHATVSLLFLLLLFLKSSKKFEKFKFNKKNIFSHFLVKYIHFFHTFNFFFIIFTPKFILSSINTLISNTKKWHYTNSQFQFWGFFFIYRIFIM